jgi:CBS domain-containing protein
MLTVGEIMSTNLITVEPSAPVMEAARVMFVRGVGSALVMEERKAVGIVTERDILRALAQHNADVGRTSRVDRWMTHDPVTIGQDASVGEALDVMLESGFRHLVVVDGGGDVAGIVSMRDLSRRTVRE